MENKSSIFKKLIIGFALIFLILFFMSQKKASALVAKTLTYQPNAIAQNNKKGSHFFSSSNDSWWLNIPLQNPYTKNNNYDLIAFRFDELNYFLRDSYGNHILDITMYDHGSYQDGGINLTDGSTNYPFLQGTSGNLLTITGVIWDSSNTARICYFASDTPSYLFCPLGNGETVSKIGLYITTNIPNDYTIDFEYEINNSFYFYNYESTEIINSNGVIVQQQQQTQQVITGTDTTGASSGGLNDINSGASSLNTQLDSIVSVNNFSTIFTTFFTQIDNSTCTPLTLPFPFTNENIVLPCLGTEFQNRIPVIWALYTTIITGVIVLRFWRFYIDMFKHLLDPYSTGLHGVSDIAGGGK